MMKVKCEWKFKQDKVPKCTAKEIQMVSERENKIAGMAQPIT